MGTNSKQIRKFVEPKKSIKATSGVNIENEKPIILFTHFNGYSVKINGFNNYYLNSEKSISAVYSFIDKIKNIQQKTIKELSDQSTKKQLHCHKIENRREIDRINSVLLEGYLFPKIMVENFENSYYEFALDNGSRVIFVRIDNIFELLFVDNNHMIYKESSRFIKFKEGYEYPSCLGKIDFSYDYEEKNVRDAVELMITAYKNEEIDNLEDFVNELEELINESIIVKDENNLQMQ